MQLTQPIDRHDLDHKQHKKYAALTKLIQVLQEKKLTDAFVASTIRTIESLNALDSDSPAFKKALPKAQQSVVNAMMKEMNYVTAGYHQGLWMSLGMTIFGVPIGIAFGSLLDNLAFLGIGLPIGMVIGMSIGLNLDQKAKKEGRQIAL